MEQRIFTEGKNLIDDIRNKYKSDEHFEGIKQAKIGCLIGKQPKKILAKIKKASSTLQAFGIDLDYIVVVNEEHWSTQSAIQHEAILYHELLHAKAILKEDGEIKYSLAQHDVEEFGQVIEKYGFYLEDVKKFAQTCKDK